MTTSTTKDQPTETKAVTDLESRIKQRRAEVIARLGELRAEASQQAGQAGDQLKKKLSELSHIIKDGVVDGWTSLGDTVKHKLEHWLSESERSLTGPAAPAKNGQS